MKNNKSWCYEEVQTEDLADGANKDRPNSKIVSVVENDAVAVDAGVETPMWPSQAPPACDYSETCAIDPSEAMPVNKRSNWGSWYVMRHHHTTCHVPTTHQSSVVAAAHPKPSGLTVAVAAFSGAGRGGLQVVLPGLCGSVKKWETTTLWRLWICAANCGSYDFRLNFFFIKLNVECLNFRLHNHLFPPPGPFS
jgi:hypothetical protein